MIVNTTTILFVLFVGAYFGGLITLIAIRLSDYKNHDTAEVLDMLIARLTSKDIEDFRKDRLGMVKLVLFMVSLYIVYPMLLMVTVSCGTADYYRNKKMLTSKSVAD